MQQLLGRRYNLFGKVFSERGKTTLQGTMFKKNEWRYFKRRLTKMNNKSEPTTKYKIQIIVNGNSLTFSPCIIIDENNSTFLKFSDRFGNVLYYNKKLIVSLEELK